MPSDEQVIHETDAIRIQLARALYDFLEPLARMYAAGWEGSELSLALMPAAERDPALCKRVLIDWAHHHGFIVRETTGGTVGRVLRVVRRYGKRGRDGVPIHEGTVITLHCEPDFEPERTEREVTR